MVVKREDLMFSVLSLIGRERDLFADDVCMLEQRVSELVSSSRFLVLGGAGSIGSSVVRELFKRGPIKLHVVDLSENNLVELVRDVRSSIGYIGGEFKTVALDIGSIEYEAFIRSDGEYDYVLNLSALKHVRSEKDPFTLMRMINVNIFNTERTILHSIDKNVKKYFCVSTDKAANPVNMMGASKLIMEMFLMRRSSQIPVSTARFANVAFSDGSLLYGFKQRIEKRQPIVAPRDIRRYFLTPEESGQLCMLSCLFGESRDIFFPKLDDSLHLISLSEVAERFLHSQGYKPYLCESEDEARELAARPFKENRWPCIFSESDTTGEKDFEEFFTEGEMLDMSRYLNIGIIKNTLEFDKDKLDLFEKQIMSLRDRGSWRKEDLLNIFLQVLPGFAHKETGKYLDGKM